MSDGVVMASQGSQNTASGYNSTDGASPRGDAHAVVKQEGDVAPAPHAVLDNRASVMTIHQPPMRARGARASSHPVCQVPGCCKDLTGSRGYHQRYKICDEHFRVPSMELNGQTVRFCQQCGKFQPISEFHDDRRSCTIQLALHAGRRRKRHAAARAAKANDQHKGHGGSDSDTDSVGGHTRHRNAGYDRRVRRNTMDMNGSAAVMAAASTLVNGMGGHMDSDMPAGLTGLSEEEVRVLRGIIRNRGFRETAAAVAAVAANTGTGEGMVTSSRTTSQGHAVSGGAVAAGNAAGPLVLAATPSMVYMDEAGIPTTKVVDEQQAAWLAQARRHQDSTDSAQTTGPYIGANGVVVTMTSGSAMPTVGSHGNKRVMQVQGMSNGVSFAVMDGTLQATMGGVDGQVGFLDLQQQQQQHLEGSGTRITSVQGATRSSAPRSGDGGGTVNSVGEEVTPPQLSTAGQDASVPPTNQYASAFAPAHPTTTTVVVGPDGTLMQLVDLSSAFPANNQLQDAGQVSFSARPTFMTNGNSNMGLQLPMQPTMVYNTNGSNNSMHGATWSTVNNTQPRIQVMQGWGGQQAQTVRVLDVQQLQQNGLQSFLTGTLQHGGSGGGCAPAAMQLAPAPGQRMQAMPQFNQAVGGGFYTLPAQAPAGMMSNGNHNSPMNVTVISPEQLQELMHSAGMMQGQQVQVQQPATVVTATN